MVHRSSMWGNSITCDTVRWVPSPPTRLRGWPLASTCSKNSSICNSYIIMAKICETLKQLSIVRDRVWGISLRSHRKESWQKCTLQYHVHLVSGTNTFIGRWSDIFSMWLIKDLQRNAKFRAMRLKSPRTKMIIGPISRALWKYDGSFEMFDPESEWPNFKYWSVQDFVFIRTWFGRNVGRCSQEVF